ncbi:MAG TPA: SDR family NAD(P)-dependent oxidoreductase [Bryobacteraceae bacterium]|jgi:NAD(P)-dependent dehydrogenase (short-subunit alcohol dehydrogenase family)|nr:SDR family NAD(P)-dependent oxidoreductase [Bryobacteraceae bacterium]
MENQVVLITGANGGLGTFVTAAFLQAGARVVGTSRQISPSAFLHPNFEAIPADLTRPHNAVRLVADALDKFGRIDALVHTTGGFAGGAPIHETDDATWDSMLELNLRAALNILRAVIPVMRQQETGRIVAIASRAAAEPAANISAYSATKAALVSLVKTAALENRKLGITANAILPSTIDTDANRRSDPKADRSKWVSPQKLAALAVFLASDDASDITGTAIAV